MLFFFSLLFFHKLATLARTLSLFTSSKNQTANNSRSLRNNSTRLRAAQMTSPPMTTPPPLSTTPALLRPHAAVAPSSFPVRPSPPSPMTMLTEAPEAAAVRQLEGMMTSGSAAAIGEAAKTLLTSDCIFASPCGKTVGRAACARYFRLLNVLLVDDLTIDELVVGSPCCARPPLLAQQQSSSSSAAAAVGSIGNMPPAPTKVALGRLTHRFTPRLLDALAPKAPSASSASASSARWPPSSYPSSPSPLPRSLRPWAYWLRERCTWQVVDNAAYYFAPPAAGAAPSSLPQVCLVRSEIAMVSIAYAALPPTIVHGFFEPLLGAAVSSASAVWGAWLKPVVAPWLGSRLGYAALEAL